MSQGLAAAQDFKIYLERVVRGGAADRRVLLCRRRRRPAPNEAARGGRGERAGREPPPPRLPRGRSGRMERGDVLVSVGGRSVHDRDLESSTPGGSPVTLQLLRAGRQPYSQPARWPWPARRAPATLRPPAEALRGCVGRLQVDRGLRHARSEEALLALLKEVLHCCCCTVKALHQSLALR